MDQLIVDFVSRMGLALPVAILVAVRVGQMIHQINNLNIETKLTDFSIDIVKEKIIEQLSILYRVYRDTTDDVNLPTEVNLQEGHLFLCFRGILLNRRNIPIMSMPIKSMLLAVNLNILVFSVSLDDMMGQSFGSFVSAVATVESAIGSAIFVITFRVRGTIAVEFINRIQG